MTNEHVTSVNVANFFGNVNKFKATNPLLTLERKQKLEKLYWKIYGTTHITNNKIMAWLVKGWIMKHNVQKNNYAKVTTSTAKKKGQMFNHELISKGSERRKGGCE